MGIEYRLRDEFEYHCGFWVDCENSDMDLQGYLNMLGKDGWSVFYINRIKGGFDVVARRVK